MQSTKQKNTPVLKYRRMKTNELTINRTSILISQAMHLLLVVELEPIEHCLGHLTGLTTGTSNEKNIAWPISLPLLRQPHIIRNKFVLNLYRLLLGR